MCCFAGAVRSVSQTKIFGRLGGDGKQYIAYEMRYESDEPNAMILPLPVKRPSKEDSVQFIDLSHYEHFFRDLNRGFPRIKKLQLPSISRNVTSGAANSAVLTVHEIGNFVASFVPAIDDFSRLDPQFTIPKETWLKIPAYLDYGFAVFQLKEGARKVHPMALAFETRSSDVFLPTVHIHDGEVHKQEEFDHTLYVQHAGLDSIVGKYTRKTDSATHLVRSKHPAKQFCKVDRTDGMVASDLLMHRLEIRGMAENRDITFSVAGDALEPSFNYRRHNYGGWGAGAAILAAPMMWLFARRNRLRQEKLQAP